MAISAAPPLTVGKTMGYFPKLVDVPEVVTAHLRAVLELPAGTVLEQDTERTAKRHRLSMAPSPVKGSNTPSATSLYRSTTIGAGEPAQAVSGADDRHGNGRKPPAASRITDWAAVR
ncbi:hypothetical protein FXW78_53965 [Rhodococcus opacus]|nr:hypothetical protein [Rhodococcus opacus]